MGKQVSVCLPQHRHEHRCVCVLCILCLCSWVGGGRKEAHLCVDVLRLLENLGSAQPGAWVLLELLHDLLGHLLLGAPWPRLVEELNNGVKHAHVDAWLVKVQQLGCLFLCQ